MRVRTGRFRPLNYFEKIAVHVLHHPFSLPVCARMRARARARLRCVCVCVVFTRVCHVSTLNCVYTSMGNTRPHIPRRVLNHLPNARGFFNPSLTICLSLCHLNGHCDTRWKIVPFISDARKFSPFFFFFFTFYIRDSFIFVFIKVSSNGILIDFFFHDRRLRKAFFFSDICS